LAVKTPCWVLKEQARRVVWGFLLVFLVLVIKLPAGGGCVVAVRGWGWSLFENCTVDASIFVVKLPRADGGCLGTRSR
jgi:hypothetical protein